MRAEDIIYAEEMYDVYEELRVKWKPYYEDDAVTIYHGDCRDYLPGLTKNVGHVITDPPYSDRTHRGALTNKGAGGGGSPLVTFGSLTDDEFIEITRQLLVLANRWVVMTCDHRHAALTFDWPEHIRLGAWVKGAPMPQISGDRPGSGHESVLILHNEGRKRWNRGGGAAIWRETVLKNPRDCFMPTQKPIGLLHSFVSDFTDPRDLILDPFMGSGTTLRAAKDLGRKAIGIEIEEKYCEIAAKRMAQAVLPLEAEPLE